MKIGMHQLDFYVKFNTIILSMFLKEQVCNYEGIFDEKLKRSLNLGLFMTWIV